MSENLLLAINEEIRKKEIEVNDIKELLKVTKKELNQLNKMKKKMGGM